LAKTYKVELTRISVCTVYVTVPDEQDMKGRSPGMVYTEDEVIAAVGGYGRLDFCDDSDYESDWSDAMTAEELEDDEDYGCLPEGRLPIKPVKDRKP